MKCKTNFYIIQGVAFEQSAQTNRCSGRLYFGQIQAKTICVYHRKRTDADVGTRIVQVVDTAITNIG